MENDQQDNTNSGYETRDINVKATILVSLAVIAIIVISLIGLNEYFLSVKEQQVYESVLKPESTTLRDLRATEEEVLNSYKLLDSTSGSYRIPISRAMEVMAEEAFLQTQDR